jgi:hypothetical protein
VARDILRSPVRSDEQERDQQAPEQPLEQETQQVADLKAEERDEAVVRYQGTGQQERRREDQARTPPSGVREIRHGLVAQS